MSYWNNRCWPWWSKLLIGILMLSIAGLWGFVSLANSIGFGVAFWKVAAGLFSAVWIIVGVVFTIHGLNKW